MPRPPKPIAYPAPIRRTKRIPKAIEAEAFAPTVARKFKRREQECPACGWFGWWYSANCPECST